ncbi:MAG TPA: phosphoribosylamine--glycine ligase [Fervidobacterium sp.]|nr:phosphoribosylamine--glycine ligase [Fervidobacterium sp.]
MKEIKSVCILGSGGREHAIGYAFQKLGVDLFFYPGNVGTKKIGKNIEIDNFAELETFDLVIPGSEEYLAKGISDGRPNVFGPDSRGARLESSKCFAKLFMQKHGIKTARFEIATTREQLYDALKQFNPPYVVKLDGLAQGKGVIITHSFDEALDKGTKLMNGNMFENVKGPVVVDEYLDGWELSAIAIVNGGDFVLLPFTKDYKRAFTNDEGPNTGGMGAYGPVQIDEKLKGKIDELFNKTLVGLEKEGIYYRGFLYIGLMVVDGEPYVLEYNVRLGDPETEVIVSMEPEQFALNVLKAYSKEPLDEYTPKCCAVDVVVASEGYPESPKKGQEIQFQKDGFFFYGGVTEKNGKLVVNGGRVLHSMGVGENLEQARAHAYKNIESVHFDGMYYRTDIAGTEL